MRKASYGLEGGCPELLSALDRFRTEDKSAERVKLFSGIAAVVAGVGAVVGLMTETLPVAGAMALVTLIALGFYAYSSGHDLDNSRLAVPRDFIEVLQADVPPKGKLRLKLDFRDYRTNQFLQSKDGGMFSSVRSFAYSMPWLHASGPLADSSRFNIRVLRLIKRREKSKRKYTKVKEKMVDVMVLSIQVDPARYPDLSTLASHLRQPPLGLRVLQVRTDNNRVTARLTTPVNTRVQARYGATGTLEDLVTGHHLLAGLVWVYQGLKAAKVQRITSAV
ncbi:MAG: hypothetical protein HY319_22155 [Armatimonadetes bacterium]|nr:hypothetical protein [Armatimonadota bacterium]